MVFCSAFLVKAPILSTEILGLDVAREQDFTPQLTLDDFLKYVSSDRNVGTPCGKPAVASSHGAD